MQLDVRLVVASALIAVASASFASAVPIVVSTTTDSSAFAGDNTQKMTLVANEGQQAAAQFGATGLQAHPLPSAPVPEQPQDQAVNTALNGAQVEIARETSPSALLLLGVGMMLLVGNSRRKTPWGPLSVK